VSFVCLLDAGLLVSGYGRSGVEHCERLGGLRRGAGRLATRAVEVVDPQVRVLADTGFPKAGKASAGVARQYSGTLSKV
jgi:DDE superfamily endonuclease